MESESLLKQVLKMYRTSGDFNGLYFMTENLSLITGAIELVEQGLIQVVSEEDYPNPHIRPWPSKRSTEQQIGSLNGLMTASYGVCLYPTPLALKQNRTLRKYPDQPFSQAMADGRGTLELAYFRFDVLEPYRNDPRFDFRFYDFGANATVADEVYLNENEGDADKVVMNHIGFAYDLSNYIREDSGSPVVRRVCAFYGDLSKLTAEHQLRWKTYQVPESENLGAHPIWWSQQMGHWPDGLGPFEKLFFELKTINEFHENAFGVPLFRTTERPRALGWILRPSQSEWESFVLLLDKLLSENIAHTGLDEAGVPRKNKKGEKLGSLNRLAALLENRKVPSEAARELLKPLRDVREARQSPAHALRANVTDDSLVHSQIELMERLNDTLETMRRFWGRHPANSGWKEPDYAAEDAPVYRL